MVNDPHNLIERYLDGSLHPEEKREFDRRLDTDPALRAELDLQAEIDQSLARVFAAPAPRPLPTLNGEAPTRSTPTFTATRPGTAVTGRRRRLAVSLVCGGVLACVLLVGVSSYLEWFFTEKVQPPAPLARTPVDRVYQQLADENFTPEFICETDQQFAMTVYWQFDQALLLNKMPESFAALGWVRGNTLTPETLVLIADAKGEKALVFIDRAENDRALTVPEGIGLKLHRATLGQLVLYELSAYDRPVFLEYFYVPDVPDEWMETAPYP